MTGVSLGILSSPVERVVEGTAGVISSSDVDDWCEDNDDDVSC
jgi:hypothetical protein